MAGVYALTCADMGAAVAWAAPTYRNSRPLWRFIEQQIMPIADRVRLDRAERVASFPSGGWIGIYTADNDVTMRGEAFDLVIGDEAAQYKEDTYTDVIMPTLADRDGRCILISTPKGRNWFWREWMAAKADNVDRAAFQAPTHANPLPNIRRAFELAKQRVAERTFRQEWMAEFLSDGTFFQNVEACATAQPQDMWLQDHNYVIGVDWARASGGDDTVFVVMDVTTRSMAALQRFNGMDYNTQRDRLKSLCKRFKNCPIIAEYNAMGGPQVEQLQADGLNVSGFTTSAASKHEIISALELAFDRKTIAILDDVTLVGQLEAYEKKERTGIPAYSAPEGGHDDMVIALALAWHGVGEADYWKPF